MPSDQSIIIEQVTFRYSLLGKAFERQIKTTEYQGIKQIEALKALKPKKNEEDIKTVEGIFPNEMRIENEINWIKKWEENVKREN